MSENRLGLYEKAMPAGLGWETMLAAAREAGFDFVEISVDESDDRLARLNWSREERRALQRAMAAAELPVRTMCLSGHRKYPLGSRDENIRRRGVEIFRRAVELADDLGVRIIQLAGYDVYYEEGGADTRAWFGENLRRGVEHAAQYGVALGFETMETPFMDTVAKGMRYVEELCSPYLGMYPDLGNLTNAAKKYKTDLYADIAGGRGHILAMHLKETVPGRYRDMRFGEGGVDFPAGIRAASEQGARLFVAECWHDGREDWRAGLRDVNDFLRAYL